MYDQATGQSAVERGSNHSMCDRWERQRPIRRSFATFGVVLMLLTSASNSRSASPERPPHATRISMGFGRTIIAISPGRNPPSLTSRSAGSTPNPRPRLAGFSPFVAIATSDRGDPLGADFEYEHELHSTYVGSSLIPGADPDFVIGFLDSGADVNLIAGSSAITLGLFGNNLSVGTAEIGGVGEATILADITMPVGFFAQGLGAINSLGQLDFSALVGHSNVCGLATPAIECDNGEELSGVIGMPMMAFYNTIIRVDTPRRVEFNGRRFAGPDVVIQDPFDPLPEFTHFVSMHLESAFGTVPVTTANYYVFPTEPDAPLLPTLLSIAPGLFPSGGLFFTSINLLEGVPGPFNPVLRVNVMVDTGAQSSIISRGVAAQLNLPLEPDFTVTVCGVGGLVEGVPGYYIDFVGINALGGALNFSRAPFVVLDLVGPSGLVLEGILGMNFFWNRNIIFEPALGGSAFLHLSDPIPFAYGDFDADLDVDGDDTSWIPFCAGGPGQPALAPDCDHIDSDNDFDVDLLDFARFQRCFSGADVLADASCAE